MTKKEVCMIRISGKGILSVLFLILLFESSTFAQMTWTRATASAAWQRKLSHASIVFDNKMWVIGGLSSGDPSDAWYSSDGINWTSATNSAGWTNRFDHAAISYNNKLWVLKGSDPSDSYGKRKDIWGSSNGTSWNKGIAIAPFEACAGFACVNFKDKAWVIGGDEGC